MQQQTQAAQRVPHYASQPLEHVGSEAEQQATRSDSFMLIMFCVNDGVQ
jgi:hypothetical protein